MLLALDVGNTNTVIGCFRGSELVLERRLKTDRERTIDEYEALIFGLLERNLGRELSFSQCVISSVVPPVTPDLVRLMKRSLKIEPLLVGPGLKTGLQIRVGDPSTVGADRVTNAVAVKTLYGAPAIVVDFGTATSFDVVSRDGSYEGGVISPGLRISIDALVERAAKLPTIELSWPKTVVGKSTTAAMQSGAVMGYVCMVDGVIDQIVREVGQVDHIIATGGIGKLMAKHSSRIQAYEPHLTLKGLQILAQLNADSE